MPAGWSPMSTKPETPDAKKNPAVTRSNDVTSLPVATHRCKIVHIKIENVKKRKKRDKNLKKNVCKR